MPETQTKKTIRQRLAQILKDHSWVDDDSPEGETLFPLSLAVDFGFDDTDILEVAMVIEDEFDITIDDGELERAATAEDLYKIVAKAVE